MMHAGAMRLIDSHCHLDDTRFDADRPEMLARARAAGVTTFIVAGTCRSEWPRLQQLAKSEADISPAYGIHPWFCADHADDDRQQLEQLLEDSVAVGECGLDFMPGRPDAELQLQWFCHQLRLAAGHHKPVIIHAVKAEDIVHKELQAFPGLRGVVHGFSGSLQQAERLIATGMHIGIGSFIDRRSRAKTEALLRALPAERILLESDAPDQPGTAHAGSRNEPAYLPELATFVAACRGTSPESLAQQCNTNASELFSL